MGEKLDEKQLNSLQTWELELLLVYNFPPLQMVIHENQAEDKKVQNREKLVVSPPPGDLLIQVSESENTKRWPDRVPFSCF